MCTVAKIYNNAAIGKPIPKSISRGSVAHIMPSISTILSSRKSAQLIDKVKAMDESPGAKTIQKLFKTSESMARVLASLVKNEDKLTTPLPTAGPGVAVTRIVKPSGREAINRLCLLKPIKGVDPEMVKSIAGDVVFALGAKHVRLIQTELGLSIEECAI